MGNEVARATKNFYEKYGDAATSRSITGLLLKFNKFGEFRAGQDEKAVPRGTALAAYMNTLQVGYVRWEDNKPADAVMGPIAEGFVPPPRAELGYTDQEKWDTFDDGKPRDPWQLSNSLIFADLESGEFYTFSSSSRGGLGAIGELSKVYGRHIRTAPDEMPLIELDTGSYTHSNRAYGEIRFPVFKVTGWILSEKLPPLDGGDPTPDQSDNEPGLALPPPDAGKKPVPSKAAPRL